MKICLNVLENLALLSHVKNLNPSKNVNSLVVCTFLLTAAVRRSFRLNFGRRSCGLGQVWNSQFTIYFLIFHFRNGFLVKVGVKIWQRQVVISKLKFLQGVGPRRAEQRGEELLGLDAHRFAGADERALCDDWSGRPQQERAQVEEVGG